MKRVFIKGLILTPIYLMLFCAVICAQGHFVYTNNNAGVFPENINTVSAFSVADNGVLTEISGSPFQTGGFGSSGLVAAPNVTAAGNFLYASNAGSSTIAGFSINASTGFLTPAPGSPFNYGGLSFLGISLAATPDNRYLIAVNNFQSTIIVYNIAANGALTPVNITPFFVPSQLDGIRISPNGKFLAIAGFTQIFVFNINSDGTLTPVTGSPFIKQPGTGILTSVDINCASNLLFATKAGDPTTIDVYSMAANGSLAFIGSAPPVPGFGVNTSVGVLSPDDQFLFVSDNSVSRSISVFRVNANGSLSVVPGSPFAIGGPNVPLNIVPMGLATNNSGTVLNAALFPNLVGSFRIAGNGALTLATGSPFGLRDLGNLTAINWVAAYPAKSCSNFDICIQDDNGNNLLQVNTTTGDYKFTNCSGFTITGSGTITRKGSTITLQQTAPDRRLLAKIDTGLKKATASLQMLSQGLNFTITDRNTANNTCACM